MAKFPSYGGTLTLNFAGGGATSFPIRGVRLSYAREALESTELGGYRKTSQPGRVMRSLSFDLYAQDGSADDALHAHLQPASLAAAKAASCVAVYVDSGGRTHTLTGFLTSAERDDSGSGMAVYACTLEEST